MAQADVLTLTTVLIDVRSRLLETLSLPASADNRARLTDLWRVCLTIHDVAESHHDQPAIAIMERMIDAIADYETYSQPDTLNWSEHLPTIAQIEAATG
jgi:hypothetical protein